MPAAIVPSAGTGPVWPSGGGFSGDGGPASQAEIDHPSQVEALPGGGYLFTDTSNHRIRLVAADGTIETIAGNGQQCPAPTDACGDNGPAVAASLNTPHDVAALPGGGFLIADTFDNRIRRVDASGTITTVAGTGELCEPSYNPCGHGGPALAASLSWPASVHVLPDGSFVIADQHSGRVRLVHDGLILHLAGTGLPAFGGDGLAASTAGFSGLADAVPLPGGGILVSDGDNCRLRLIDPTGDIATVAGSGPANPCNSPTDEPEPSVGDNGPATAARIQVPGYVDVLSDGTKLVVDFLNNRVRRIAPDGIITTVAGDGLPPAFGGDDGRATAASLAWPSGVAALPAGGFLVTDSGNNRVRRVGSSGPGPAALPERWNPGARPPLAVLDASVATASDGTAPLDVVCPADPADRGCTGTVQILVPGSAPLAPAPYDYQAGQTATLAVPASAAAGVAGARVAVETTQGSGKPGGLSQPIAISAGSAAAAAASAKRSADAARLRRRPLAAPALVGPAPLSAREAARRGIPVSIACPSACSAEAVVRDPRTRRALARVHLRTGAGGVDGGGAAAGRAAATRAGAGEGNAARKRRRPASRPARPPRPGRRADWSHTERPGVCGRRRAGLGRLCRSLPPLRAGLDSPGADRSTRSWGDRPPGGGRNRSGTRRAPRSADPHDPRTGPVPARRRGPGDARRGVLHPRAPARPARLGAVSPRGPRPLAVRRALIA
ncbi:MAG: hypothetical protein ACJ77G_08470 [Solirubrobacteraceae bacterium]